MTISTPLPEWKVESIKRNHEFYLSALMNNELTVADQEYTKRISHCEICGELNQPGVRKFLYRDRIDTFHFWFIYPCEKCWDDLTEAAYGMFMYQRVHVHSESIIA